MVERARDVVECRQPLAVAGDAHPDAVAAERVVVVCVVRLVELEHDVVAHVDHVADRALPDRSQAGRHPRRARTDDDSREHGEREPPAPVAVDDLDLARSLIAGHGQRRRGWRERQPELRREITRDPDVAVGIGPVAGDVEVEHDVGDEPGDIAVRHADRRVGGQDENAAVVGAEPELACRAQHAVGVDAEDAPRADRAAVRHLRAQRRQRHHIAGSEVGGAAPDVPLDAVAGVDPDPDDLGGVRVELGAHDAGRDHTGDAPSMDDLLHRKPKPRASVNNRIEIELARAQIISQPSKRDLHQRIPSRAMPCAVGT